MMLMHLHRAVVTPAFLDKLAKVDDNLRVSAITNSGQSIRR
jgi:hypothetical protein